MIWGRDVRESDIRDELRFPLGSVVSFWTDVDIPMAQWYRVTFIYTKFSHNFEECYSTAPSNILDNNDILFSTLAATEVVDSMIAKSRTCRHGENILCKWKHGIIVAMSWLTRFKKRPLTITEREPKWEPKFVSNVWFSSVTVHGIHCCRPTTVAPFWQTVTSLPTHLE